MTPTNSSPNGPPGLSADARAAFARNGYHLLRPLFDVDEVAQWCERINAVFDLPAGAAATAAIAGNTFTLADGVTTNEAFWPIIFNAASRRCPDRMKRSLLMTSGSRSPCLWMDAASACISGSSGRMGEYRRSFSGAG